MAREDHFVWQAMAMSADLSSFSCPRCSREVMEVYYGPCVSCRGELIALFATSGRTDVVVEEYEPKMNVTPNAVALKDD